MSSESFSSVSAILSSIESDFEVSKSLNQELVKSLFEELRKLENGESAVKEFSWLFGLGESERHQVDSKECILNYLVDFKTCRKYLSRFMAQQD